MNKFITVPSADLVVCHPSSTGRTTGPEALAANAIKLR
jgi:hypothetical protein